MEKKIKIIGKEYEKTKAKADCFDILRKYIAMGIDDYGEEGIILNMESIGDGDVKGGIYLTCSEMKKFKKAGFLVG